MDISGYKKTLQDWLHEHEDFYKGYVRAMKDDWPTLQGYMHVYEYGLKQIPELPDEVEFGQCDDLFTTYYDKSAFTGFMGVWSMVYQQDKLFALRSLFGKGDLKLAIASWLMLGNLHTCIISRIQAHPKRNLYADELHKLEKRIIRNSLITGIKDADYWHSAVAQSMLIVPNEELDEMLSSYTVSSEPSEDNFLANKAEPEETKAQKEETVIRQIPADFANYFVAPFRGIGQGNIINYYTKLEESLTNPAKTRSSLEYAKIAYLIFCSNKVLERKRPQTFSEWYRFFCNVVGCEFNPDYKPSKLKDTSSLEKEFSYLF